MLPIAKPHTFSSIPSSNRKNGMGKQGTTLIEVSENTTISASSLKKGKIAVFPQALSIRVANQYEHVLGLKLFRSLRKD